MSRSPWRSSSGLEFPTILYSPYAVDQPGSIPAYAVMCFVTVGIIWLTCMREGRYRLPEWGAVSLLVAAVIALSAWYGTWGPIIGATSDNLDALAVGVEQLLMGANPWGALTFLDNVPAPMLGGFILAAPFVIIPSALFLQPLVWLAALFAFVARSAGCTWRRWWRCCSSCRPGRVSPFRLGATTGAWRSSSS